MPVRILVGRATSIFLPEGHCDPFCTSAEFKIASSSFNSTKSFYKQKCNVALHRLDMAILLQKVWFTAHQISYTVVGGIEVVSNQLWGFRNVAGSYWSAHIRRVSTNTAGCLWSTISRSIPGPICPLGSVPTPIGGEYPTLGGTDYPFIGGFKGGVPGTRH